MLSELAASVNGSQEMHHQGSKSPGTSSFLKRISVVQLYSVCVLQTRERRQFLLPKAAGEAYVGRGSRGKVPGAGSGPGFCFSSTV